MQTMEEKDTYFCEESFVYKSLSVLEILTGGGYSLPMATQAKKAHAE